MSLNFPEFKRGEPVERAELKRMNAIVNRAASPFLINVSGPGAEMNYDDGISIVPPPDVTIRAQITGQIGGLNRYSFVETTTLANYPTFPTSQDYELVPGSETPKIGGLTSVAVDSNVITNTYLAVERNGNLNVPIGSFVDLWLGDDGTTWFFLYEGTSSTSPTFTDLTVTDSTTLNNLTVTGKSFHTGPESFTGGFLFPQGQTTLGAGVTNNWNPGITNGIVDITPAGNATITGALPPVTPADGFMQWYYNDSSYTITLPNQSGSSSPGYQYLTPGGTPVTLQPGQAAPVKYSGSDSAFLVFIPPGSGSSSGPIAARMHTSSATSIPGTGTFTPITTFGVTEYDTTGGVAPSSGGFVIPTNGVYAFGAFVTLAAVGSVDVVVEIINGVKIISKSEPNYLSNSTPSITYNLSGDDSCAANDSITVQVYMGSGGTMALASFWMHKVN